MSEEQFIEKTRDKSGVYFLINEDLKLCKYGSSNNIFFRIKAHKSKDFKDFTLHHVVYSDKHINLENKVRKFSNTNFNNYTEIIKFDDIEELYQIYDAIDNENSLMSCDKSDLYEIKKLEIERLKIINEGKKLEVQRLQFLIELKNLEELNAFIDIPEEHKNEKFLEKIKYNKGAFMKIEDIYEAYKNWYNSPKINCVEPLLSQKECKNKITAFLKAKKFKYYEYKRYRVKTIRYYCFKDISLEEL